MQGSRRKWNLSRTLRAGVSVVKGGGAGEGQLTVLNHIKPPTLTELQFPHRNESQFILFEDQTRAHVENTLSM